MRQTRILALSCMLAGPGFVLTATAASAAEPAVAQEPDSSDQLSEITVTARRRAENNQTVPVAVSVFDANATNRLQIRDATDLNAAAPNLFTNAASGAIGALQVFMRGLGQDSFAFNVETPVAIYVDDVVLGRNVGAVTDLLDFDRIEVLRGPQGSLYGRNSTGGAIKYVAREPDLEDVHFKGDISIGNFGRFDARGVVSVPLVKDHLAIKVSVLSRKQTGYMDGVDVTGAKTGIHAGGIDRKVGRVDLAWTDGGAFKDRIAVDGTRDRSGVFVSTPFACQGTTLLVGCAPLFGSPYKAGISIAQDGKLDSWGVSNHFSYDGNGVAFKAVTAWRGFNAYVPTDFSSNPAIYGPLFTNFNQDQFSQEVQLSSTGQRRIGWTVGLFYYDETIKQNANFFAARINLDDQKSKSYAAFGELYWNVVDNLRVTVGLRHTWDRKDIHREIFSPITATTPIVDVNPKFRDDRTTPKFSIDYRVTPDLMFYATYANGYKSGGFGFSRPANLGQAITEISSEDVDSFEGGFKSEWFDHHLRINATVYKNKLNALQSSVQVGSQINIANSKARTQGVELEVEARPIAGWMLYGHFGTIDSKYLSSNDASILIGGTLKYAPKTELRLGTEYRFNVPAIAGDLFAGATYTRVGKIYMDGLNSPSVAMPTYDLIDARVGYASSSGRYTIALEGKNLSDTAYWRSGSASPPYQFRSYAPPRTVSATFGVNF